MKRFILLLSLVIAFLPASGQSYILTSGEVYLYDFDANQWQRSPLSSETLIHKNDSIMAKTAFTVSMPLSLRTVFKTREHQYRAYNDGVRFDPEKLEQIQQTTIGVNSASVSLSRKDQDQLLWISRNLDSLSPLKVHLKVYLDDTWQDIDGATVSSSELVRFSVINEEPFNVFAYVFVKDKNGWSLLKLPSDFSSDYCGIEMAPNSLYTPIKCFTFNKPYGEQTVMLVCSRNQLSNKDLTTLNKKCKKIAPKTQGAVVYGFDSSCFNVIK